MKKQNRRLVGRRSCGADLPEIHGYPVGRLPHRLICVALLSYQFPQIVGNGIGPNAGRDPRLRATQSSHPPACRRGPGMAPRTLSSTRDAPPPAEAGFHRPPAPVPPFVHHAAAYWREGFAQPAAGAGSSAGPSGATPAPAAQPHLPVELGSVRRRWEALPLTREGS